MKPISLGQQTDLAILELTGSEIKTHDDHVVVKTPQNPNYHWGNFILVLDPAKINDCSFWVRRFEQEFPNKDWIALDLPEMPIDTSSWEQQGVVLEKLDVLSTDRTPNKAPLPFGDTTRAFQGSDWEALILQEIAGLVSENEYEPEKVEAFVRETNATRQRLCQEENAAWFGAFLGEDLVANLGVIKCGKTARFQSVETHPDHIRKGLASHLLGVAASWSEQTGCDRWVIVTEETNDAGRVYRRAGFSPDLASVTAYRKPTG
jgi:GNAT superfamily N-acetyltransferase